MTYDQMSVAQKTAKLRAILKSLEDEDAKFMRAHIKRLEVKAEVSRLAHEQIAEKVCASVLHSEGE